MYYAAFWVRKWKKWAYTHHDYICKKLTNTKQKLLNVVITYKKRGEQNERNRNEESSHKYNYNIILKLNHASVLYNQKSKWNHTEKSQLKSIETDEANCP